MNETPPQEELFHAVSEVSEEENAEILLYAGPIYEPFDDTVLLWCNKKRNKENCILILSTYGGSADAAFRIARRLKTKFIKGIFNVLPFYRCKSAGTLLSIGGDVLIIDENTELGPLDVQIIKQDELGEYSSGLTSVQALATLRDISFELFESHFLDIRYKSNHQISTKLAAEIASSITKGLLGPIYTQIDPMRLGQTYRSMNIAMEYGDRLNSYSDNLKPGSLNQLIAGYPSHSFVVDRNEVSTLFKRVLPFTEKQSKLLSLLQRLLYVHIGEQKPCIRFLTDEAQDSKNGNAGDTNGY